MIADLHTQSPNRKGSPAVKTHEHQHPDRAGVVKSDEQPRSRHLDETNPLSTTCDLAVLWLVPEMPVRGLDGRQRRAQWPRECLDDGRGQPQRRQLSQFHLQIGIDLGAAAVEALLDAEASIRGQRAV